MRSTWAERLSARNTPQSLYLLRAAVPYLCLSQGAVPGKPDHLIPTPGFAGSWIQKDSATWQHRDALLIVQRFERRGGALRTRRTEVPVNILPPQANQSGRSQ